MYILNSLFFIAFAFAILFGTFRVVGIPLKV